MSTPSNEEQIIDLQTRLAYQEDTLNALSTAMLKALGAALGEVASDPGVRALVLTGEGRAFAAGADIEEMSAMTAVEGEAFSRLGHESFASLEALAIPTIAAVHGVVFGGGFELAMACTFRVATQNARFGLPEIKLGLIPGYGGTQRLPRLVGEARALEMIMTGRSVRAEEALQMGLVNRVEDSAEATPIEIGLAFARTFSGFSLPALGFARAAKELHDLLFRSLLGQQFFELFLIKRHRQFLESLLPRQFARQEYAYTVRGGFCVSRTKDRYTCCPIPTGGPCELCRCW